MMQVHTLTCPACEGTGRRQYELTPNHPSGRMGWETCPACNGDGEIIDLSKCCECGDALTGDGDEGYCFAREASVCGPCNRGEIRHKEAA